MSQNSKMKLRKGDQVKIIAGSLKGKTGKIVAVNPEESTVKVEGLNIIKKHVKPSAAQPQGGIIDVHQAIDASKVAILVDGKKDTTSRIGYIFDKNGDKKRIYKVNNKEIDV